ncbi:DNA-binding response regulator [Croceicoccus estronivorus]|uniref:response regulator transcription factor n=1 Tax=Croceicoccus estronivorus TaxID=1172626 RepID=UPI000834D888|nr:response regulator transcription factor [Croceicoccus estronivorus]OCC23593.1 DNA-binding response regulator [Croceicoccus estronivorus]
MRLGLLEDDLATRQEIEAVTSEAGHTCHGYATAKAFKVALRQESFDLLLLDWNVPDASGLDILHWAQEMLDPCPPAIMITSRMDSEDIVKALEAGADDYMVKPLERDVLVARIGAVLRRTYPAPTIVDAREDLWGMTFDHGRNVVDIRGREVALTAKEFGLALTLFRNMGRPLSRVHLLETVWGRNPDLPTRTLDVHVSKIRARLGLRPYLGYRLLPVHSFGYRLEMVPFANSKEAK